MSELNVQKFLRLGPDEDGIALLGVAPYFISVKQHPKYPNLYQFTYSQIDSPKGDPIVRECRGLILDRANNWNVVAYPFNRFFNEGEGTADTIDWASAVVQEKVDGTLIIMYYYDNDWQIATRGSPDAGGNVGDTIYTKNGCSRPMTFEDLFWHSAEYWLQGLSHSAEFCHDYTYMWELTSPYNRVVCDYTKLEPMTGTCIDNTGKVVSFNDLVDRTGYAGDGSRITLIGVRDNEFFYELPTKNWKYDIHFVVKEFPLQTLEQVIEASNKLNPLRQEGFVVVDKDFHRIKIKSPAYVAIHHLRDGSPKRRLMEIIKTGESDELVSYKILDDFPIEKGWYEDMLVKVNELISSAEILYESLKDIPVQKDFALKAIKSPISGSLFALRKGQIKTIREGVLNIPTDKLLELIGM